MNKSLEILQRRALDAAQRIASAWANGPPFPPRTLHTTAWILARAGRSAPQPADRASAEHVAITAAAVLGDRATILERVTRGFEMSLAEGSALLQGLAALGPATAETTLDLALAHPDAEVGGAHVAADLMRVAPHRADEWLDRMQHGRSKDPLVEAVVEIVIAGRDRRAPHARAEAAWRELDATPATEGAAGWDGRVRMTSREDPELAARELLDATALVGRRNLASAHLTFGRWARADSEAATRFVNKFGQRIGAWGRWARGLTFDGVLPEAAREGWTSAVADLEPGDAPAAGQLYAVAVRLGDLARVDEVLARVALSPDDRVDLAAVAVRLLARTAPDRAVKMLDAIRARLPGEDGPGGLHDELAVLTDVTFDVPWWSTFLPDLP